MSPNVSGPVVVDPGKKNTSSPHLQGRMDIAAVTLMLHDYIQLVDDVFGGENACNYGQAWSIIS